jgi:FMN phosphatase YigB (HAD superfamily)
MSPTALLIQSREDLRLALNNLWQFEDAFDEIFVSVDQDVWAQEMPDLSRALLQLHVKAGQATLIDDDPRHVRAAKAAGMQAIRYHDPAQIGSAVFDVLVEQAA